MVAFQEVSVVAIASGVSELEGISALKAFLKGKYGKIIIYPSRSSTLLLLSSLVEISL